MALKLVLISILVALTLFTYLYLVFFLTIYRAHAPKPLPKIKPPQWTSPSKTLIVFKLAKWNDAAWFGGSLVFFCFVGILSSKLFIKGIKKMLNKGPFQRALTLALPAVVQAGISPVYSTFNEVLWFLASWSAVLMYFIYYHLYANTHDAAPPNENYLGMISSIGYQFSGLVITNLVLGNWSVVIACSIPPLLALFLLYGQWKPWLLGIILNGLFPWIMANIIQPLWASWIMANIIQPFWAPPAAAQPALPPQVQGPNQAVELVADQVQNEGLAEAA